MTQVKLNIQVENESHCDFNHLREMLLRVNLEDLRSSTHTKHYEVSYLSKIGHFIKNSKFQHVFLALSSK